MKTQLPILAALILFTTCLRAAEPAALPEPGPEDGGLRLGLLVTPRSDTNKEGFNVRLDLHNTSNAAMTLRAGWRHDEPGDVKDYLAAATSIQCVPAVVPWRGGVLGPRRELPQPAYVLKAGEVLSIPWQTKGRHLKNRVTDPNEVQNPEFPFPGLYSVHANLDVITSERVITLRSNEQLVPVGGSRAMPKSTYGRLLSVDSEGKTAVLDLGARHKVKPGDQFMYYSKVTPWKLTIARVSPNHSWGQLELLSSNNKQLPRPGMGATLKPEE